MLFDLPKETSSIIKVIGVGGGGSNAVNHMFDLGIVGVDFAICNTDNQAMELSKVPTKIQLGPDLTEGLGAGSKPDIGRQACIESIDEIKNFLANGTKMLFVTAGMGGGTGTGAAPIIAKAAQEMDILTVGIVTLPFSFEGRRRSKQGVDGLDELKKNVDTLIVISNDKLRQIHGNLKLSQAFSEADDILSTAAKGIAEIITVPGYVNVDFEDVNTVMRGSGVAIMGTATSEGEDRAKLAVDEALNSPLLEENDIQGAQHILLNITSGNKEVTMDEIFEITEFVQEEAGFGIIG
jgi:cell division protein FtsZ